jgi:hypothetical protein
MLITVVQRLVRTFDEDLAPLKETGGGEPGERAEENLLEKRGVHSSFKQHVKCHKEWPTHDQRLPKSPLLCVHNP